MYFAFRPKSIDKKKSKENSQNVSFKFHKKKKILVSRIKQTVLTANKLKYRGNDITNDICWFLDKSARDQNDSRLQVSYA